VRGPADVAAETRDLGHEIVALEHLARLAQGQRREGRPDLHAQATARVRVRLAFEVCRQDRAPAVAEDQDTFDQIAQLAQVARPFHRLQRRRRLGRQGPWRKALCAVHLGDEMLGQNGDVLGALREPGHADGNDRQSVKQFLPEPAICDPGSQVVTGR
jgi:hypothetical protein